MRLFALLVRAVELLKHLLVGHIVGILPHGLLKLGLCGFERNLCLLRVLLEEKLKVERITERKYGQLSFVGPTVLVQLQCPLQLFDRLLEVLLLLILW